MSDGISLVFDDTGAASVEEPTDKSPCFGGVLCEHAASEDFDIQTLDGRTIPARSYFCKHANQHVNEFLFLECPISKWRALQDLRERPGPVTIIYGG